MALFQSVCLSEGLLTPSSDPLVCFRREDGPLFRAPFSLRRKDPRHVQALCAGGQPMAERKARWRSLDVPAGAVESSRLAAMIWSRGRPRARGERCTGSGETFRQTLTSCHRPASSESTQGSGFVSGLALLVGWLRWLGLAGLAVGPGSA